MWNWANDGEIAGAFTHITLFEKTVIIFWTTLPLLRELFGHNVFFYFESWMSKIIEATPAIHYLGVDNGLDFSKLVNILPYMVLTIVIIRIEYLKPAFGWPSLPEKFLSPWTERMLMGLFAFALAANIYSPIYGDVKTNVGGVTFASSINITALHQLQVTFLFFYALRSLPIPAFLSRPALAMNAAFIITVLTFAIAHDFSFAYVVTMLPMGAIYLLLMVWFGNIWLPVIVHFSFDALPYIYFTFIR